MSTNIERAAEVIETASIYSKGSVIDQIVQALAAEGLLVSRDELAEAFIRGMIVGADHPEWAGDMEASYQAFVYWDANRPRTIS